MTVDGFNASQATTTYPPLTQLSQESVEAALGVVQDILPSRIQGTILTQHPQLLAEDLAAKVEFLTAFGFEQPAIQELLRSSPEAFYNSNIFQAGELLLFLRQTLQLPEDAVMRNFKWAAVLGPGATQESMQAVVAALQEHLATAVNSSSSSTPDLLPHLQAFPEVLGWDVAADLMPKLRFFEGLGQPGQELLRGTLWEPDSSWLPGLRSWSYSVAPKLALLRDVLGSEHEAQHLILQCPTVLKLPIETKLQPVLGALTTLGLTGGQVADLLRSCPQLMAQSKDGIVSRVNFLTDAIGGTPDDLLTYPGYALLSLSDVIGPRYYFLARQPGWLDAFSEPDTGALQLARVMGPDLPVFLDDVAKVTGADRPQLEGEYEESTVEWNNLLGWCCEKAFSNLDQVNSMYQESLNLFYLLVC